MKYPLLHMAVLAVLIPVGVAQSREPESPATPTAATLADEVKAMEKRYTDALMKKDLATLEKIWSPDYTFTNGQGKLLSRAERLENVKTGATEIQSTEERDVQVRVYGGDAAVLVSHVTLSQPDHAHRPGALNPLIRASTPHICAAAILPWQRVRPHVDGGASCHAG